MSSLDYILSIVTQLKRIPDIEVITKGNYQSIGIIEEVDHGAVLTSGIHNYLKASQDTRIILLLDIIEKFKTWYQWQRNLSGIHVEMLLVWKPVPFPISLTHLKEFRELTEFQENNFLKTTLSTLIGIHDWIPTFAHSYLMEYWNQAIQTYASNNLKTAIRRTLHPKYECEAV